MSDSTHPQDDDVVETTTEKTTTESHSEAGHNRVVNDDDAGTYTDVDLGPDDVGSGSGTA
ncbi:MAG: hypothetical protein ABWY54_01090 [Glaciihabitans sp.]